MDIDKIYYNIVREIQGEKGKPAFLHLNKSFIDKFIFENDKIFDANIYVHRIIANIGLTLKNIQFHSDNDNYSYQLQLFDDEFLSINNSGIVIKMNSQEICKGGNYDKLQIALEFLSNYEKKWYVSENSKGQKIKSFGGLINNATFNEKTGNFQFFISAYWLKELIDLTYYNSTYYLLTQNLTSNKQMIFWHWLSRLPLGGTTISVEKFNTTFDLEYKDARNICKGFLNPMQKKLNVYSHQSFNYSYKNNKINIAKFERKADEFSISNNISEESKKALKKNYNLSYIVRRHKISDVRKGEIAQMINLESHLILTSYSNFIKDCRENKESATKYINEDFIQKFQEIIISTYLQTSRGQRYPKAYPLFLKH